MKPSPSAACSTLPLTSGGILQGCNGRIKYKQGSASRSRGEGRVSGPSRQLQQGLIYWGVQQVWLQVQAVKFRQFTSPGCQINQLSQHHSTGMEGELKTTGVTQQETAHASPSHHFGKGCKGGSKHPPSWRRDPKTLHAQGPQPLTLVAHRPPTFNPLSWGHILNTTARWVILLLSCGHPCSSLLIATGRAPPRRHRWVITSSLPRQLRCST